MPTFSRNGLPALYKPDGLLVVMHQAMNNIIIHYILLKVYTRISHVHQTTLCQTLCQKNLSLKFMNIDKYKTFWPIQSPSRVTEAKHQLQNSCRGRFKACFLYSQMAVVEMAGPSRSSTDIYYEMNNSGSQSTFEADLPIS